MEEARCLYYISCPLSDRNGLVPGLAGRRSVMADGLDRAELDALAASLRSNPALVAKNEIGLGSEGLGGRNWVLGPGDDGAVVPSDGSDDGEVIACGEALLPAFVAADPYGAGIAAVLANVNDLAAMGATPLAIVDTIVGTPDIAREALR